MTGFPPGGDRHYQCEPTHGSSRAQPLSWLPRACAYVRASARVCACMCVLSGAAWEPGLLSALQPAQCVSARMCAFWFISRHELVDPAQETHHRLSGRATSDSSCFAYYIMYQRRREGGRCVCLCERVSACVCMCLRVRVLSPKTLDTCADIITATAGLCDGEKSEEREV